MKTSDGGYVIAGRRFDLNDPDPNGPNDNDWDMYLVKTDGEGSSPVTMVIDDDDTDHAYANCVIETIDGYVVAGYIDPIGGGNSIPALVKRTQTSIRFGHAFFQRRRMADLLL